MADDRDSMDLSNGANDILELDTSIASMSDEEFDRMMSGEDVDDVSVKKAQKEEPVKVPVKTPAAKAAPAKSEKTPPPQTAEEDIEEIPDINEFFKDTEGANKGAKKKAPAVETSTDNVEGELEKGKESETKKAGEEQAEELDDETARVMMSNTYNHLVKTGVWKEVEGEGFDPENMTPDVYAQIATQQASEAAHEAFDELMDRTGKYRTILDHALRNGNPDEIINLFKEEHFNNALDLNVPTDQKELIRKYYKNILEWDDGDVESFINKAEADNELNKYSAIAKKAYQKHIDSTVAAKNSELKLKEAKALQDRNAFIETMTSAVDGLKLPRNQSDTLKRAIFDPAFKVSPEKSITAFQAQMLRIQQNPQEYLDLIQFVIDKKGYLEKASVKKENQEVQQNFKIKLNSGKSNKNKEDIPVSRQSNSKEQTELKFFSN